MIVLSEKKLDAFSDKSIEVKYITYKSVSEYEGNADVEVIACSRATAIKVSTMDFPNLKLIQLTSAGFDNVPLDVYRGREVAVANAGSVYSTPIAEMIVYGILQMAKKYRKNPNNHFLRITRGYKYIGELMDKRALIMGTGNIGTAVAKRLNAFDMIVSGYDPYSPSKPEYTKIIKTREELISSMGEYDYIISTMPDTNETKKFIDGELIAHMKNTAVFVNVGRRAVIDERALYKALKKNEFGGAVLDMFEKLPNPIQNPFRRLSNTIVLPGVAAISKEVTIRLREHISRNVELISQKETPTNVINGVSL